MENCFMCGKKIPEDEYIENGGYCKECMDKREKAEKAPDSEDNKCLVCGRKISSELFVENGGLCNVCAETKDSKISKSAQESADLLGRITSNSQNIVANKFSAVSIIIKFIGYTIAFIAFIAASSNVSLLFGIILLVSIVFGTWLLSIFYDAIAEIINLLQDIKNNTSK